MTTEIIFLLSRYVYTSWKKVSDKSCLHETYILSNVSSCVCVCVCVCMCDEPLWRKLAKISSSFR